MSSAAVTNGPEGRATIRAGRYERHKQLASGGMGAIYLAYDRIAQREVAYKRMADTKSSQRALRLALFRREYETLAKLPHPNIVEVYGYGEEEGHPYYVMELLGGADLSSLGPLHYREACRVLRDIASALSLVHTRRLVHRDVSPNNVRLTDDGTAKLLDFGALTPFGQSEEVVGTAAFMAPECLEGASLDQRSDLYSLGATAYWMLTRTTPFPIQSLEEASAYAYDTPPPPPSRYAREIPRELDELVLSMLARDPRARPANASHIIERLTSIAELGPESDERRVAQSYLAHPPLSGRGPVLRALRACIDHCRAGTGQIVLIESEAGVGRSSVLASVSSYAELHGCFVLHAQGRVSAEQFGVVRQLAEGARTILPDLARTAEVAIAHPGESGQPNMVADAERHALMVSIAQSLVSSLSARAPVVLAIDDVDSGDAASIAVLASLAGELRDKPVAIVLSCLARRSSRPHGVSFAKLVSGAEHVTLGPLSQEDVGDLVQTVFGAVPNSLSVAHWLYAQSAGNAAIALDYLRLLAQRGLIRYALGTFFMPHDVDLKLPAEALHEAARSRLMDLGRDAELITQLLSLHEGPLTHAELAHAAGLTPRETLLAIEELAHRDVVVQAEHGSYIAGSSLRATIETRLSGEQRKTLHLRLADSILSVSRGRPDHLFDASLHLLRGGRENEALGLIVGVAHRMVYREVAARHAPVLVEALAVALRQRRSKEACLSLMLPLATSGFHGDFATQQRYIDTSLAWMSEVCGLTLARKLRPFVGGKLSLLGGLAYAALRRLRTKRSARLGPLSIMITYFVGLICDSTAMVATLGDAISARRFVDWLSPLSVLPKGAAGWVMREFCLATSEAAAGKVHLSAPRYATLVSALARPIKGLENTQNTLYLGSINGFGLCQAALGDARALKSADDLGSDALFAPHAEVIRVSYYALRGDRENAERHRARAEALALRGGTAWTASSTLSWLAAYSATLAEDAVGIVQSMADLEPFTDASPAFRIYRRICAAWLEHVRGHSLEARRLFEQVITRDEARGFPLVLVNWALYANVLNTLGDHEKAHAVCLMVLDDPERTDEQSVGKRLICRELAVAKAGLGQYDEARALVLSQLRDAEPVDNPLELGLSHRDAARIGLLAGDQAMFDRHFEEMAAYFQATHNPCLIRQCDTLLAKAEAHGLRTVRQAVLRTQADELDGDTTLEPTASLRR